MRGWVKDGQLCHRQGVGGCMWATEWAVGAPANRAKHDLVSNLKLNNRFFCLWELKIHQV